MPADQVELRGMVSREITDVLDAVSMAHRRSRMNLVEEILSDWVAKRLHEASFINSVTRSNPAFKAPPRKNTTPNATLWPEVK